MLPILIIAAVYIWFNRPDIVSTIAGGLNYDAAGLTSGNTPFAQSLISTEISPMGSSANPRLMTYTSYAVRLPDGATQADADYVINNRGSNIPLRSFQFADRTLYLTVITNDADELAGFDRYLRSIAGAAVTVTGSRTVRYYLLADSWVSEDDADAFIADCPRQKLLNPGMGECPTSW